MMLPMAGIVGMLEEGVGPMMREAGLLLTMGAMEEEVRHVVGERSVPNAERQASPKAAGVPDTLALGNGVTYTWNGRLQLAGLTAGNLLALSLYPCDQGQTACTSGNNGQIWRQTISVANQVKGRPGTRARA